MLVFWMPFHLAEKQQTKETNHSFLSLSASLDIQDTLQGGIIVEWNKFWQEIPVCLPGWSGQKLSVWCMLHVFPTTYQLFFNPLQQCRQQALRTYCPNIYTVFRHISSCQNGSWFIKGRRYSKVINRGPEGSSNNHNQ